MDNGKTMGSPITRLLTLQINKNICESITSYQHGQTPIDPDKLAKPNLANHH